MLGLTGSQERRDSDRTPIIRYYCRHTPSRALHYVAFDGRRVTPQLPYPIAICL
jgi:hypothetical protein